MCASFTRIQLEAWLKAINVPADSKVLDIGGSQNPVVNRIEQENILSSEFMILDLEEPHEKEEKPDFTGDLNKFLGELKTYCIDGCITELFDIAFCMEVSEYWWNQVQALNNINYLLKNDGILYISFHFIYPVHNPTDQDYLRYTKRGVEKLLEETGFEIVEIKPRLLRELGFAYGLYSREEMRPARGYDFHNWAGCLVKAQKK